MKRKGQSLVEAIVAVSLFTLTVSGLVFLVAQGFKGGSDDTLRQGALAVADEGLEAVSSIREQGWPKLTLGTYGLVKSSSWGFSGSSDTTSSFTRSVLVEAVSRDSSGNIATSGTTDQQTKKVTVTVSWIDSSGTSKSISLVGFFSNFSPKSWTQANWSGGSGQTIWSDSSKYSTDNGNIDRSTPGVLKLKQTN